MEHTFSTADYTQLIQLLKVNIRNLDNTVNDLQLYVAALESQNIELRNQLINLTQRMEKWI
jgi:phage shock protein A